ncbi:fluoride efflux transporter CrcB [Robertmurraya yapensis]|uniref:Fluoride-specific ion channel FluC n=1 Tax=Bacillus yapensis TaxID=2492960 RepID=A0A3S0IA22_9BACI|nr:fluoride efflux transporter CrcB [Bacillus yapensis]RTR28744.1 fluoride efflux transporter CrcB [Bacillus yapensis]TKS94601.1 fluoride efflux transporter CrcB [Bacillus yapensis]
MKVYLYVGLGGAVGSVLRYGVGLASLQLFGTGFPFGTILINIIGAFILGWLTAKVIHPHVRAAIGTGLIGSFTTFSTLSVDVVNLIHGGKLLLAATYIFVSLFGGLLFAAFGFRIGEQKEVGEGH